MIWAELDESQHGLFAHLWSAAMGTRAGWSKMALIISAISILHGPSTSSSEAWSPFHGSSSASRECAGGDPGGQAWNQHISSIKFCWPKQAIRPAPIQGVKKWSSVSPWQQLWSPIWGDRHRKKNTQPFLQIIYHMPMPQGIL